MARLHKFAALNHLYCFFLAAVANPVCLARSTAYIYESTFSNLYRHRYCNTGVNPVQTSVQISALDEAVCLDGLKPVVVSVANATVIDASPSEVTVQLRVSQLFEEPGDSGVVVVYAHSEASDGSVLSTDVTHLVCIFCWCFRACIGAHMGHSYQLLKHDFCCNSDVHWIIARLLVMRCFKKNARARGINCCSRTV